MATNAQCLCLPMNCNLLMDIILKDIDSIQLTAMSFPNGNHKFTNLQLIHAGIMKLKSTRGIYSKAFENFGQTPFAIQL